MNLSEAGCKDVNHTELAHNYIHVVLFLVLMPCSVVVGYQIFEDHAACNFRVKLEAAWSSKTLVSYITSQKTLNLYILLFYIV
jgi:hypothetical protein